MKFTDFYDDLESRIDDDMESILEKQWEDFCDGKCTGIFSPLRGYKNQASIEWPQIMLNDALGDPETMALSEYKGCSNALAYENGSRTLLAVRSNYGTGILPCAFGAKPYIMILSRRVSVS